MLRPLHSASAAADNVSTVLSGRYRPDSIMAETLRQEGGDFSDMFLFVLSFKTQPGMQAINEWIKTDEVEKGMKDEGKGHDGLLATMAANDATGSKVQRYPASGER